MNDMQMAEHINALKPAQPEHLAGCPLPRPLNGSKCGYCTFAAKEYERGRREERGRAIEAVRAACANCEGSGTVAVEGSRDEHAPGCEGDCRNCPVEVQTQDFDECEYCGRPVAAIRALDPETRS